MKNCIIGILLFMLAGCIGVTGCAEESTQADLESSSNVEPEKILLEKNEQGTASEKINWDKEQFIKDQEEFVNELNLDGIGVQNDSIRLTSYKNQDDVYNSYVLLKVILNQDETIQKKIWGFHKNVISITHGNLFAEDVEGFVIRLRYYGSNYGGSDIYAYEVVNNNGKAELVERLSLRDSDGENDSRKDPASCLYRFKDELVFDGKTYFIEELNQYGILVQFYVDKDVPAYIVYWKDDEWRIFEDKT